MPNDFFTIKALSAELQDMLSSGKIDKIYMPEKDEISLLIRAKGNNHLLAISCNANNPRIHLTNNKKPNPIVAPSFCMHLRKHLTGAIINKISILGEDRIIAINVSTKNEMRDTVEFTLIAEMMGRYSNILLINSKNIITDTLKQVPFDTATKRCLLPSAQYTLPNQNKILPSQLELIKDSLRAYKGNNLTKYICSELAGFSPQTAKQLCYMAKIEDNVNSLSNNDIDKIISNIELLNNIYTSNIYQPCVSINNNNADDYFILPYNNINCENCNSLNNAIDLCIGKKDDEQRRLDRVKFLQKAYNSFIKKLNNKIAKCNEKLQEANNMDYYKKIGDLITTNLYKIKKGDTFAIVEDYYEVNCPDIKIYLNNQLSPQANAQAYFKKYAKLKRAQAIVSDQLNDLNSLLDYTKSILPSIELCYTSQEIFEVAQELESLGALKQQKNMKQSKQKPTQPITYEINDFIVTVGKNNLQNDKLTFKVANGNDLWIHTKNFHGSHVIIFTEAREIPDFVIQKACEICAYYSQASQSASVECDYTPRKNLKRHPSGKPGMVLYSIFKTALVKPNSNDEYLIKE